MDSAVAALLIDIQLPVVTMKYFFLLLCLMLPVLASADGDFKRQLNGSMRQLNGSQAEQTQAIDWILQNASTLPPMAMAAASNAAFKIDRTTEPVSVLRL